MNKRWINTKVEFIWDGSQYVEQSSEGYWYDGEMALCATGASATVDGRDTFLITAEWDTLSVKGRVIDWGGANLHIGYDTDHSSHAIFLGNSGNVNHVLVETVNGIYLNQTNSTIRLGTVDSASGRLDVRGDAGTGYGIATTGDIKIIKNSARLIVGEGTSGGQFGQISWNHTDNTLCLGTEAGGEQTQLQLDGDSNVGINTNPTKNLSVYFSDSNTSITAGHGLSGGADGSGVLIYNGNSTANSYANLDFRAHTADGRIAYQTSGADNTADFRFIMDSTSGILERMCIIGETGNVGIGDESPSYKLEVAGTFYASGSSQAFKKNVTDLAVDSSAIYNLNPVSYNYKKDYENFGYDLAEGKQFGLISEEVAESVPELAIMKDGEPKNVDYQKLSVLLLAEMQKMNKRIKDLECHI